MSHPAHGRNRQFRCSRALALVALLLLAAWQVQEFGHHHAPDERVAECLLCKGSSDTVVSLPAATSPSFRPASLMLPPDGTRHTRATHSPFDARAPPVHS
jgi:hypothetical protein